MELRVPKLITNHQSYNITYQNDGPTSSKASMGSKITRRVRELKTHFHMGKPKALDSKAQTRSLIELISELKKNDKMLQVEGIFRIAPLATPSAKSVHEDDLAITLSNDIKKQFKVEFLSSPENKARLNIALRNFIDNKNIPSREELPEPFVHMISLCQCVTQHAGMNKMDAYNLAAIIAPNVLGDDVDATTFLVELSENTALIKECIERAEYS